MEEKGEWKTINGHPVLIKHKNTENSVSKNSSDGAGGTHEATEAEKRRMSELGITENIGKDRKAKTDDANKTSIKEQVRAEQEKLKHEKVLLVIPKVDTGMNFRTAIMALQEKLSKSGGVVSRKGLGDVQVSSRLKASVRYIKSAAEIAAFSAVPIIIEKGVLIDVHNNHKGRDYATYTFAGKVSINGQEGIVAVVVKKTTGNFYKVHRVLTPDGKDIEIKNDTD